MISNRKTGSGPILDCYNPKINRLVICLSVFNNKIDLLFLVKGQNNSNRSSLVISPIGFLNSSKLKFLLFTRKLEVVLTFEIIRFFT